MKEIKKVKSKKVLGFICFIIFILSGIITFIGCTLLSPKIYLKEKEISIAVNSNFKEPEYRAYAMNQDISDRVKVMGKVEPEKLGTYKLTYEVDYFIFHAKRVGTVHVVDDEAPVLSLKGATEVSICPNATYQEEGYLAQDNYDGDLTDKVKVTERDSNMIYEVADSSGNLTKKTRMIHKEDKNSPSIVLNGLTEITLTVGTKYTELGYQVTDDCDGDLTEKVEVTGEVNSSEVGTYLLTYQVTDSSGNKVTATRVVKVVRPSNPTTGNGTIYLTFDDGPSSSITGQVLDILKEEGVKATFFVINHGTGLDSLIQREFEEGHTVALHSYSHNYANIYQSMDTYFSDLEAIQEKVYHITGNRSKIIRFPGGSSNTISKKYHVGIMSILSQEVLNRGYHYFDWNVSSGDAGEVKSSEEVYQNVTSNLSYSRSNVVLMHDFENNYYTLNALRKIIQYGKMNGYSFKNITMDTPMVTHKVVN